jgi:hypothetical protein
MNNKTKTIVRASIGLSLAIVLTISLNIFQGSAASKTVPVESFEEFKTAVAMLGSEQTRILLKADIEVTSEVAFPAGSSAVLATDGSARAILRGESYLSGNMLSVPSGASLAIDDSGLTISGNSAEVASGAMVEVKGSFLLQNGSLEKSAAPAGSKSVSPCIAAIGKSASVAVTGGSIRLNRSEAANSASAVYLADGASFRMDGGEISSNSGASAVVATGGASAEFASGELAGNQAEFGGAALAKSSGTLSVRGGTFKANKAVNGSAIAVLSGGKAVFRGGKITMSEKAGEAAAGAVYIASNGEASFAGAAFYQNKGGAYVAPEGSLDASQAASYGFFCNEGPDVFLAKSALENSAVKLSDKVLGGGPAPISSGGKALSQGSLNPVARSSALEIQCALGNEESIAAVASASLKASGNEAYALYVAGKATFSPGSAPPAGDPSSEAGGTGSEGGQQAPTTGTVQVQIVFVDANGKESLGAKKAYLGALGDDYAITGVNDESALGYLPKDGKHAVYMYDERMTAQKNSGHFSKEMNAPAAVISAPYTIIPNTVYLCFAVDSKENAGMGNGIPDYY